jgi:hypothetical protein
MTDYSSIAPAFEAATGWSPTPLQLVDADFTARNPIIANFSEVGTGKTVVSTLGSILRSDVDTTLVVVPPILIPQWTTWLTLVGRGPVCKFAGSVQHRATLNPESARWVVMSHAIYRDSQPRWTKLGLKRRLELILDEAHALKNPASVLFKSVLRQPKAALQLLTGTPTSKPLDAYAYIRLKSPEAYRNVGHFESIHVEERDFFGAVTKWRNLEAVAEHLNAKSIRRTKGEVFGYDLKPIFEVIPYDLHPRHLKLYNKLVDEQLLLLPSGEKIDATTATRLYHAMQQAVCNWSHFAGTPERSAIYDLVDQVIDSTDCLNQTKSKLIIFTHYKLTSRTLLKYLGPAAVGAYSEVDSNRSIERFLADPAVRILVGQPSSCGVGLNPAHLCSEVLFVEASTVPLSMEQAIGRVDRYGQTRRPTIRFAQAAGTIQRRLYDALLDKASLVGTVEKRKSLRDDLLGL